MTTESSSLLINAPLKEVIFEIHWELDFIPQQKIYVDNGFDEAVINFKVSCQSDEFKEFQLLFPPVIPSSVLINRVTHRFFKKNGKHPLYQMGPGVFTVNDNNKNYSWSEFKSLILKGTSLLNKSFKKDLVISKIELRYIDSVNCSVLGESNKFDFLRKNLNVNAESYHFVNGELIDINFSKRFLIKKDSYLNITVATGKDKSNGEDLIIWHTFINNKDRVHWENLEDWLDNAHESCSDTFKKMINKNLYEYFNR